MNPIRRWMAAAALVVVTVVSHGSCARQPEAKRYPLKGQVLAANRGRQEIRIKPDDSPGFMAGMTMSFPVADPALLSGREQGELVVATLEVVNALGKITSVTGRGMPPLPGGPMWG